MTRVEVDRERCVGSGTCELFAPDVVEVGDDGVVRVLVPEWADGAPEEVREAVQACPTQALILADRHRNTVPGEAVAGRHGAAHRE